MRQGIDSGHAARRKQQRAAILFVMMLGLVSLLADVALEGSRSIMGTYLVVLGASAMAVSLISGLAELTGYGLRVLFGWFIDETRRYWTFIFIGYGLNIIAVPALAFAGSWEAAMGLIMLERVGRAMRCPARDAMLSHAGESVGRGWGYGIQEALSSVGGMIGPLVIVLVLLLGGDRRTGLEVLLAPCLLSVIVLIYAWRIEPGKGEHTRSPSTGKRGPFPRPFWLFLLAGALIAAGYADFPLISYHIGSVAGASDSWIATMYALAMASDALSALVFGRLYDRVGMMPLVGMAVVVPFFTPLVFSADLAAVAAGMLLYGVGFGAQESVMRAVVADMVPSGRQGTAFGCYNAAFGVSWFLGSTAVGMFYGTSWTTMILLSMGLQFTAAPLFVVVMRMKPWKNSGPVRGRARAPSALPRPGQLRTGDLVFVYEARPTTMGSEAGTLGPHSIPVTPDIMVHGVTNMTIDSTR